MRPVKAMEARIAATPTGAVAVGLVTLQLFWLALMIATPTSGRDPFDSLFWWLSWPFSACCAAVVSRAKPWGWQPAIWALCLTLPLLISVTLLGTVWHDPADGASFVGVGVLLLFLQGLVVLAVAENAGRAERQRRRHVSHGHGPFS